MQEYYILICSLVSNKIKKILPPSTTVNVVEQAMHYMSFARGKMYRAFLLCATARIFTKQLEPFINAATALELIHTYTLIHDDLPAMDDDDHRRGQPSCHRKFDEATAILAGNALLILAYKILASPSNNISTSTQLQVIEKISLLIGSEGTLYGQYLDIQKKNQITNQREINLLKTSNLFIAAVEIPTIICSAILPERSDLRNFATYFGLAYQMLDDLTDGENNANKETVNILKNKALKTLETFGSKASMLRSFTKILSV